ncbi:MAG: hypothetical protein FK734_13995 [Asgard group archaeon]|nr:hypothetical protein [Asgard group archaeon]
MTNISKLIDNWAIIGRPGYAGKKKKVRRLELEKKFGANNWKIAHLIQGKLLDRIEALTYFEDSYFHFFSNNPEILDWLILTAKDVYDTSPTNTDSGLDYTIQETEDVHLHDIAIRRVLNRLNKNFQGNKLIEIRGQESEGAILSTGQVPFHQPELILQPQLKGWWQKNSIESFWQSNKVLAINLQILKRMTEPIIGVVLRTDFRMGKGKFSTQAAHAIVSLLPQKDIKWDFDTKPIEIWTVKGEANLLGIYRFTQKNKVNSTLIRDAGKTQISPGTKTAVGIGPINAAEFDKIMCEFSAAPLEASERSYRSFENIILTPL